MSFKNIHFSLSLLSSIVERVQSNTFKCAFGFALEKSMSYSFSKNHSFERFQSKAKHYKSFTKEPYVYTRIPYSQEFTHSL